MNYRVLAAFGSVAAIALGSLPAARAADAIPANVCRQVRTPSGSALNLRAFPSANATAVGMIGNGQQVQFNGSRIGSWVTVAATTTDGQKRTGWAWEGYLNTCSTTVAVPATTPRPTPATADDLCRRVTYGDGLSVHEAADFTSRRLGSVARGSQLRLESSGTATIGPVVWAKIVAPLTGWVAVKPAAGDRSNVAPCK